MEKDKEKTDDSAGNYGSIGVFMSEVKQCTLNLLEAIKNSAEYKRYQKIHREIKDYPDKMRILQEFRERNYFLQNNAENIDLFKEIDKLEQKYSSFRNDPLIEEYLEAENVFFKMLREINWALIENLDIAMVLVND